MQKFFTVLALILFALPAYGANESPEWVSHLKASENSSQLAIVSGTHGSNARFSFHEKDDSGIWREIVSCNAYVGKKGWGKSREGDMKTPAGIYTFTEAFGILEDPGCPMGYLQVDDSHYWIGDSNSQRYNTMVSTRDYDGFDKKDSEHIVDYDTAYKYCLNISYNENGTPGKGSAIFLHCQTKNKYTAGCVSIPEGSMRTVLQHVRPGCAVVMDSHKAIRSY